MAGNIRYVLATSTVNRGSTTINIASSTIPDGKYHLEIKASDVALAGVTDRSAETITVKSPQSKTLTIIKGSYSYSLRITSRLSGSYYFKTEDSVTSLVFATSSLFSITPVTLTVSPRTQSSVRAGQPVTVSWSDTGIIKSFSVKVVSVLGGSPVTEKTVKSQGRENADSYTWKTPKSQTLGGYYFVVSDVLNPQITATSS